jgi:predicted acylesterase/phospholipase RssA/transcriptional regulator with AAA-type ATPase domain
MKNDWDYPIITKEIADKLAQLNLDLIEYHYEQGQLILKHGDVSERLQIIIEGEVRIFIEQERKVQLAILQKGQFFGEMSCLTGDPVSASVEAVGQAKTITVTRDGMKLLMAENETFRDQIIEAMISRIKNSNDRVMEENAKSLLLLKEHDSTLVKKYGELIGESEEMQKLLKQVEQAAVSQSHLIIYGEPGTEKLSAAKKVHDYSTKGTYPFLVVDCQSFEMENWKNRLLAAQEGTIALEHAELLPKNVLHELLANNEHTRIIILSTEDIALPTIKSIFIPPLRERIEDIPQIALNYMQSEGVENAETILSDEALRFLALFPYLNNNVDELKKVIQEAFVRSEGRRIYSSHIRFDRIRKPGERPTIGLALGSGSARGLAHFGVLKVLQEEGIPVDMIAGTSAGSIMGAAFARGLSIKECEVLASKIGWGNLVRPTFSKQSLVHNGPLIKFVKDSLGDIDIEDLNIPYAAVAADVLTGEAHIMKSGSVAMAIAASTAIPSVMRPVQYQGKLLSDGAIVHPVPAALVKSMGADIVIAVNVATEEFVKGTGRTFIDVLMNTIDIMSAKIIKEELQIADVILKPDLGEHQVRFKDYKKSMMAGEKITVDHLWEIKKSIAQF